MIRPQLTGSYLPACQVSLGELEQYFDLFRRHYDHVSFEQFQADFQEKDYVIVLKDACDGIVRGFSMVAVYERDACGMPVRLLFSGDTIVDQAWWGQQELVNVWCELAGRIKHQAPEARLYWALISKGYRTYLYLPLFAHEFYPRYDRPTPAFERTVMQDFGWMKFPSSFDPRRGVIAFETPHGQLREDLAAVPPARLRNPHVKFFLERNPGYRRGDELVCLAELAESNIKAESLRQQFMQGETRGLEVAAATF